MKTTYDKPFLRYDQLIKLMRSRNIEIKDVSFAMNALSNMSYYTIVNGYKDSALSIPGTDLFIPGTQFEELYTLHLLDVSLSNLILKNILYIERALKSRLSYIISRNYGVYSDPTDLTLSDPDDYLYRGYYSTSNGRRNNTLRQLKGVFDLNDDKKYKSKSLIHYIENHNHVPPWILTTSLTFGQVILWFSILSSNDKSSICNSFIKETSLSTDEKKEYLRKSFDLLKEYRNNIAHGARTFLNEGKVTVPKKQILILSNGIITKADYKTNIHAQKGLFAVIAIITTLLNDQYLLASFKKDLGSIIDPYKGILINRSTLTELFNLPRDIVNRIKL